LFSPLKNVKDEVVVGDGAAESPKEIVMLFIL
jgi:hypothetical protein